MKRLIDQIMKFSIVGVIAFIIDYGLLIVLTEVFGIWYLLSATISFIASVIFNYVASMRYVFTHKEGMSKQREFIIFVVLSAIGLVINNALMYLGTDVIVLPVIGRIPYWITKIFATAVVMVWNFVTRKKFLDAGDPADVSPEEDEGASSEEMVSVANQAGEDSVFGENAEVAPGDGAKDDN